MLLTNSKETTTFQNLHIIQRTLITILIYTTLTKQIIILSGSERGCSTTADVFINLTGDNGESSPRKLKNFDRECFQRNETDTFLAAFPYSLGSIQELEIWHNNQGLSPGWYLMQIQVLRHSN